MAKDKSHPIREGIIVTVLGAAIVSLAVHFIPGGWRYIFDKLKEVYVTLSSWLQSTSSIWNWLLLILVSLAILVFGVIALGIIAAFRRKPEAEYTEDMFFGVRWRWRFYYGKLTSLYSFCPKCDLQVYPKWASVYRAVDRQAFHCPDCGWRSDEIEGTPQDIEESVTLLIQRELRKKQK